MTALKPIENRRVRGVAARRYLINEVCAHPECSQTTDSVHHIFPRSLIGNDSWFVAFDDNPDEYPDGSAHEERRTPTPHATGLCGSGTTGHHGDLEEHRSWIKLEDGVYTWYDRVPPTDPQDEIPEDWQEWVRVGELNPQPGSREGKAKKKRTVRGTPERAERKTVSVRLPEGTTGEEWDELLEEASNVELQQQDTQFDPAKGTITVGKLLVTILERFTGRVA